MISQEFNTQYKRLNPKQREAVDAIEGPVMVVAGPGTGKTQILTLRIANILLKTQSNPENILALTFTESAAWEMRKRLSEIIGTSAYRVEIATFHSFCNDIIINYMEDFPGLVSSSAITEVEQIQIMEKLILNSAISLLRPFGDPIYHLKNVLSEINNLKKEGITPEKFEESIKEQKIDFEKIPDLKHENGRYKGEMKGMYQDLLKDIAKNEELLILYRGYQENLRESRKYDFNDMLLEVKAALEANKSLLLRLQEKYQYILVDEHQDTNGAQNAIVELLSGFFEVPNLFVVGDEKQAIYRFQGASLENFLYFKKRYKGVKVIFLEDNYRSTQKILDSAHSLIQKNVTSLLLSEKEIKLKGQRKELTGVSKIVTNDYFSEFEFIAREIEKKIKKGMNPSEIAVIARNNKELSVMGEALERYGVAFNIRSDQNILEDRHIQKLILILKAVDSVGSDKDLLNAAHVDLFSIAPLDIYKLLVEAREKKISVYEAIEESENKSLKSFYEKISRWQTRKSDIGLEELFVEIVNESGLRESMLTHAKRYELLDKLISLFETIKTFVSKNPKITLSDFLEYIELCNTHEIPLRAGVQTVLKSTVNLMTAHRSKGLEFDTVFIINAFDGHWGNSKRRNRGFRIAWEKLGVTLGVELDINEDERRLFYVALTRARKEIFISYSTKSMEGREQFPTQFLEEIEPKLIEEIDTKKFEEEFLSKKDSLFDVPIEIKADGKSLEFFKELFLTRGMSPTALDNFLKCPWRFFYQNLLQFPEAKNKNLIFGLAVHFALDSYIKVKPTKDPEGFLIRKFEESLDGEFLSEMDRKELLAKGKKALSGYLKECIPLWGTNIESELRIKGIKLADGIIINGRLDMIEHKDKISGEVVVHDFKTGKPKSRIQIDGSKANSDSNYLRQLVFYKILLDNYKGGLMKMREGIIDFVESDEKGRFKSERFEITESMTKELENLIVSVSNQIINLSFWDERCGDKTCEYCKLRQLTLS